MTPLTAIVAAFLLGLVLEAAFFLWSDHRAVQREQQWWEELRADAIDGYGRVFDWAEDTDP